MEREEEFQNELAGLPPLAERRRQLYSVLVRAAVAGAIDPDKLAAGIRPETGDILPFAGLDLQQRFSYFNELLSKESPEDFLAALKRGQEIIPPPIDWPSPSGAAESQENSYQRLMAILSMMADREGVPVEAYYSWGGSVTAYYRGPYSQRSGDDNDAHWGTYYAKDLMRFPGQIPRRLNHQERNQLESSFVNLHGIPHLDRVEDLRDLVAALPPNTQCFALLVAVKR